MENELSGEQRRHSETQKALRRHERRAAELSDQLEIDVKAKERENELMDKLHQKLKQYKRQLDEAVSFQMHDDDVMSGRLHETRKSTNCWNRAADVLDELLSRKA